jgi:hypothetical protein
MQLGECLAEKELGNFLSGRATSLERRDIEIHLGACRACRHNLATLYIASRHDDSTFRAPARLKARALKIPYRERVEAPGIIFGLRRQIAVAIMAVVLVTGGATLYFLIANRQPVSGLSSGNLLRQGESARAAPQLIAPASGATIDSDQIEFRWSEAQGAESYLFFMLDEKGNIIFQSSTSESRLIFRTREARIERGRTYFWYVTAKSADGSTLDSDFGSFISGQR